MRDKIDFCMGYTISALLGCAFYILTCNMIFIFCDKLHYIWEKYQTLSIAALFILLSMLIYVIPAIVDTISENDQKEYITVTDFTAIILAFFSLGASALDDKHMSLHYYFFGTFLLFWVQKIFYKIKITAKEVNLKEVNFLAPLENPNEDMLYREALASQYISIIKDKSNYGKVFGITGSWGIGKTTTLKFLCSPKLISEYHIIYFDTYFYKDPINLLETYLDDILRKIELLQPVPLRTKISFRKLFSFFASTLGKYAKVEISDLLNSSNSNIELLIKPLQDFSKTFKKPMLLLIDDIDRLELPALSAILKVTSLLKELSNTIQVLAFDKHYLATNMYGFQQYSNQAAQDYLEKLIDYNLSIPVLAPEIAKEGLKKELIAIQNLCLKHEQELEFTDFNTYFDENLTLLCYVLVTPRKFRKVIYLTKTLYEINPASYNLFDLFVLQCIHYCYPDAYSFMEKFPQWFTLFSTPPELRSLYAKHLASKGAEVDFPNPLHELRDKSLTDIYHRKVDQYLLGGLLSLLSIKSTLQEHASKINSDERQFDKKKRLVHCNRYYRYFNPIYTQQDIVDSEIEKLDKDISSPISSKDKINMISLEIEKNHAKNIAYQFLEKWRLISEEKIKSWNNDIIRSVAIGLAQASNCYISTNLQERNASEAIAFAFISELIIVMASRSERLPSLKATDLVCEIFQNSPYFHFSGLIYFYIKNPEQGIFESGMFNIEEVQSSLSERFTTLFKDNSIFDTCVGQDLLVILYWLKDFEARKEYILRDLKDKPNNIFFILDIFFHQAINRTTTDLDEYLPFYKEMHAICSSKLKTPEFTTFQKELWGKFNAFVKDEDELK